MTPANGGAARPGLNWAAYLKMADVLQIPALCRRCVEDGGTLITQETAAYVAGGNHSSRRPEISLFLDFSFFSGFFGFFDFSFGPRDPRETIRLEKC